MSNVTKLPGKRPAGPVVGQLEAIDNSMISLRNAKSILGLFCSVVECTDCADKHIQSLDPEIVNDAVWLARNQIESAIEDLDRLRDHVRGGEK